MLLKKFLLAASITTGLVLCSSVLTFADVTVKIGNDTLETDQPPVIVEGRTLVPFRAIYEGLGAEVEWNDATREATGKRGQTTVTMAIDKPEMVVNGETIALDVPAKIINDRTMVPVRAVSDGLDETVDWDPISKTVKITTSYVDLNTDPEDNARIHPGWLDEIGLEYRTGFDPEYPCTIHTQEFDEDDNGNRIWKDSEVAVNVTMANVAEGQVAKDIAITQGALDVDKLEQKVKNTFGSAKWYAVEAQIKPITDYEGYYSWHTEYDGADLDPRSEKGEINFVEKGISYVDYINIHYNNELYKIATASLVTSEGYYMKDVHVFCLPEDYDNLLMWFSGWYESTVNDLQTFYADVLVPRTNEDDEIKAAIWFPLKKQ